MSTSVPESARGPDRIGQLQAWLSERLDGAPFGLEPASSDASFRRYFRVRPANGASLIAMDAPPALENCEPFIRIAGAATQLVVEVRHKNFPAIFFGEQIQNVEQDHRIRAARNGDEGFLAGRQQPAILDFGGGTLEEFTHAEKLHFPPRRAKA